MSLFGREAQIKGDTGDQRVPWGVSRGGLGARRGGFLVLLTSWIALNDDFAFPSFVSWIVK